jgi:hypothetical protein
MYNNRLHVKPVKSTKIEKKKETFELRVEFFFPFVCGLDVETLRRWDFETTQNSEREGKGEKEKGRERRPLLSLRCIFFYCHDHFYYFYPS